MIAALKKVIFYICLIIAYILIALTVVCEVDMCKTYLVPYSGTIVSILTVLVLFCVSTFIAYLVSDSDVLNRNYNKLLVFASIISRSLFIENSMLSFFLEKALDLERGTDEYNDTTFHSVFAFIAMIICSLLVYAINNSRKKAEKNSKKKSMIYADEQ